MQFILLGVILTASSCYASDRQPEGKDTMTVYSVEQNAMIETESVEKSDSEWKANLTPEAFKVLRKHGTERAFSGPNKPGPTRGVYRCAGCGLDLFLTDTQYDSGTGWPSFWAPVHENNIGTTTDYLLGRFYPRTEVHCIRCKGHLGHVFDDGPEPTGLRYCMNSVSMTFVPADVSTGHDGE
jgi:peptide-methionine (R)-S-oxide reductase